MPSSDEVSGEEDTIDISYVQASDYKTSYAEGVIGGITPNGKLAFDFYFGRGPTPSKLKRRVLESGELGEVVEVDGKEGVIRQKECGVVLDPGTVLELYHWLEDKLHKFEEIHDVEFIQEEKNGTDS